MKYKILFSCFILIPLCLYAQPDSSRVFIRFNGGYTDYGSSNGVASQPAVNSNNTAWETGLSAGFSIARNWEVGLGVAFQKQKTEAISEMDIFMKLASLQYTETEISLILGKIYVAGYRRLFSRLYFNPGFAIGIGKGKGTQKNMTAYKETIYAFPFDELPDDPFSQSITTGKEDISYDYMAISFTPAFTFFFNRHIALSLETGCFQFNTTDWDRDNRRWIVNINPAYWKLGVVVSF